MASLRPQVDKMPLVVRKNSTLKVTLKVLKLLDSSHDSRFFGEIAQTYHGFFRDQWESKRPDIENQISELLGETWTCPINPNLLYAYAEDSSGKERMGDVIMWYMEPFISNLKEFLNKFGNDGKSEINTACYKHQVTLYPDTEGKFSYCGSIVSEGVLQLVFRETYLGTNVSDASSDIANALKNAPPPPGGGQVLDIIARHSISTDYDPEIGKTQKKIGEAVNMPTIKLNPNFEDNAVQLKKHGDLVGLDWNRNFGKITYDYFYYLADQIQRDGFNGDDMLQEGFQEGVTTGEITLRVVDKLVKGNYNEVVIEDGVLYLQTVPTYWGTNIADTGTELMNLL